PTVVAHGHGEVVLDGDAGAEHVLVTVVAVQVLGVQEQALELGVGGQVQGERVAGGEQVTPQRRSLAQAPRGRVLRPVEAQPTESEHRLRDVREPPVHQVEVVGGLVHGEPAGAVLLPVPAAEVVRTVHRVQAPLEVYGGHRADRALGDQPAHRGVPRRVAVVARHGQRAGGLLGGAHDALQAGHVDGHRLLGDHVQPAVQPGDDVVGVRGVLAGDDQHVRSGTGEHLLELLGGEVGRSVVPGGGEGRVTVCLPGVVWGDEWYDLSPDHSTAA